MFSWPEFLYGVLVGIAGLTMVALVFAPIEPDIRACAKKHNVYRCELIAAPVTEQKQ